MVEEVASFPQELRPRGLEVLLLVQVEHLLDVGFEVCHYLGRYQRTDPGEAAITVGDCQSSQQ